ncbi:MAG: MBL fold metallo-hydrolase [Rhodospirillaceae bacterium]|nr:MBL fold metallo-hydrolase [Rhodospirillaceae bacterium]
MTPADSTPADSVPADSTGSEDFFVRFRGVRGTIACPGGEYARYGGNTSCLEVRCAGSLLILDAGTGLRALGAELDAAGSVDTDILLTHTHIDHIAGMPFFVPLFKPGNRLRIHAGHLWDSDVRLRDVFLRLIEAPIFPVPLEAVGAEISFEEFRAGDRLDLRQGIAIRTAPLNHPNGATGYRIEWGGRSICYVTDTEHVEGEIDTNILELIEGADIFVYDATYTEAEYPAFRGWGHSTWEAGAVLAERGRVGKYVIFHHAPDHTDDDMDRIADAAQRAFASTVVAREGLVLRP